MSQVDGNLLERGIGFYLTYEEAIEQNDGKGLVDPSANPGHVLGFALASVYVLSPLDFIPDFIPVIGVVDDAVVLRFGPAIGGYLWNMLT